MPERKHAEQPTYLQIPCRRARVLLAAAGVGLAGEEPAMLWDEHGGILVIRVSGLTEVEVTDPSEPGMYLEISLAPGGVSAAGLKEFAGRMNLPLRRATGPAGDLDEPGIMAAAHLPGHNLFAFCEEPHLTLRRQGTDVLELRVNGDFKTKTLPSRETDLVIHLTPVAMAMVVSYVLALVQEAQA